MSVVSSLALAAAVAALPVGAFDCEISKMAAMSLEDGKANASMIEGLPTESLKFRLVLSGHDATVDWPNSPIQVAGKQVVLPTGPGAGAAMYVSGGPCLFTEIACASMVSFVEQPDHSLKVLITPTAISHDTEKDIRFPFLVLMEGRCVTREDK